MNRALVLLGVVCVLMGCANNLPIDTIESCEVGVAKESSVLLRSTDDTVDYDLEKDKELLYACGYDTIGMVRYNNCYFLESRYRITAQLMDKLRAQGCCPVVGRSTINHKLPKHYQHIYFSVSANYNNARDYLDIPVELWNGVGDCGLQFQTNDIIDSTGEEQFPYVVDVVFSINSLPSNQLIAFTPLNNVWENYPPYGRLDVNTSHERWKLIANNEAAQRDLFLAHLMAELVGFEEIESNNFGSIFLSDELLTKDYLDDHGWLWYGITEEDKRQIRESYPTMDDSNIYSFTFSPALLGEENCLYTNTDYSLEIDYLGNCCDSSNVQRYLEIYKGTERLSSTLLSFDNKKYTTTLNLSSDGAYVIKLVVVDDGLLDFCHEYEQTIYAVTVTEELTSYIPSDEIQLNNPYLLRYYFNHPLYPNASIEYSIEEGLFGINDDGQVGATIGQAGPDKVVVIHKEGCYFLHIVAKVGGLELSHKIINITKLNNQEVVVQMELVEENSSYMPYSGEQLPTAVYEYKITQSNVTPNTRTAFLLEFETEERQWFDDDARRVDRHWCLNYKIAAFEEGEDTQLSYLYIDESVDKTSGGEFCKYYTGNVYYPTNGARVVDSDNILRLPMKKMKLTILNDEDRVQVTTPSLNVVD